VSTLFKFGKHSLEILLENTVCTRVVQKVSALIYIETQYSYNNCDQFIFLHNLRKLQSTYSSVPVAAVFQSRRRVHLAIFVPEGSPPQMQWFYCQLKIVCHTSVLSAMGTSRSQRILDLDVATIMSLDIWGVFIVSSRSFKCVLVYVKRSFYAAVNGLFGKLLNFWWGHFRAR